MDTKNRIQNRIILESLREVPQEIMFNSLTAKRDQIIPNRYHFKFPEQWANQLDKDAIIGIRDFYMVRQNRYILFELVVWVYEPNEEEPNNLFMLKSKQRIWLDQTETLEKIPKILEEFWFDNIYFTFTYDGGDKAKEILYNKDLIDCWYLNGKLYFGRLPHKNNLEYEDEFKIKHQCEILIQLTPISDDAKAIFGTDESILKENELSIDNVYSRHQLYLTSSISNDTEDNFLGHTRNDSYIPMKYYRLTSESKQFWIDLWDTRNHNVAVILPKDNKDVLYMEAIVCFNASAMI